jgi:c(7)-type cytochrome triheme protein
MRLLCIIGILSLIFVSLGAARTGGGDIAFKGGSAGEVIFRHDSHAMDAGFKCTDCHDSLYVTKQKDKRVTMAQMQMGKSCGACHNGKKAFDVKLKSDCSNCHKK